MRGLRTPLVLVLLLAGIVAALYFTRPRTVTDGTSTEAVLGGHRLLEARHIAIRYDMALPAIEIEHAPGGEFRLVEPVVDLASEAMLDHLARVYDTARMRPRFAPADVTAEILAETDLAPGNGALRIAWDDGHTVALEFGGRGVLGDDVYVRRDGAIGTVHAGLRSALDASVADYRERFVFRNTREQVETMALERRRKDGTVEKLDFHRSGAGFALAGRDHFELDQAALQEVIDGLLALRAEKFLDGTRRVGPRLADIVITVTGMLGGERAELTTDAAGAMTGWVTPRGVSFTVEAERYGAIFDVPLQRLRSQMLLPADIVADLAEVSIAAPGSPPLVLQRVAVDFELTAPLRGPTNPTAVSELLTALGQISVVAFVADDAADLAPYGLDDGYLTLRLRGGPGPREVELHIGAQRDAARFARRVDSPHVVAIPAAAVAGMLRPWTDFVSLRVAQLREGALARVLTCTRGATTVRWTRDETGGWRRDGATAPDEVAAEAFDVLRDLAASRAEPRDAAGALSAPIAIALEGEHGTPLLALQVFERADGDALVGVEGMAVLFSIARRDAGVLLRLGSGD